ncbi:MAG: TOBE domain-containing protein, partial [Chloroflexi bacterium]
DGPLVGIVIAVAFLGATSRVTVDLGDTTVLAQMPTSAATLLKAGTKVRLAMRTDPVLVQREEPAATAP